MSGACKRLFVTCVVAVLACGWSTAQANSLAAAFLPGEATTNSIWNLRVSWTQGDKDPTPKTIVLSGVGFTIPMTNPYLAPEPGQAANVTIWRLAMSRGLNMSRKEQQCKMQRVAMGEDASTVPDDDGNPCLLRDPRGNPMFYTPGLCSNDDG